MRIKKQGKPLSEKKVSKVESRFGFRFPEEYRAFLLEHNGGTPEPDELRRKGKRVATLVCSQFLGIETGRSDDDFLKTLKTYKDPKLPRLPDRLVPIAGDPFGNLFCISTKGIDTGAVYHWSHEDEGDPEDRPDSGVGDEAILLVADSFDAFLSQFLQNKVRKKAKAKPEWVDLIKSGDVKRFRAWLDAGGNPLSRNDEYGKPVDIIFWEERSDLAIVLLERGVDPKVILKRGIFGENWGLVGRALKRLKERGEVPPRRAFQDTLDLCPEPGVIKAFLDAGADPNHRLQGGTPLHHATGILCEPAVVRLLLKRGARASSGGSALTNAILNGNLEVCKMLIDAGENLYAKPPFRRTSFVREAEEVIAQEEKKRRPDAFLIELWRSMLEEMRPKSPADYLDGEEAAAIRDEVIAYAAKKGQNPPQNRE